jgi:hypothetical protein
MLLPTLFECNQEATQRREWLNRAVGLVLSQDLFEQGALCTWIQCEAFKTDILSRSTAQRKELLCSENAVRCVAGMTDHDLLACINTQQHTCTRASRVQVSELEGCA